MKLKLLIAALSTKVELVNEIYKLNKEIKDLKTNPQRAVEDILGREIKYLDVSKLTDEGRLAIYNEAQLLLRNRVFQSLVGKAKNIIEQISRYSKNFDEVRDLRMTINGVELIRQYAEDIQDPRQQVKKATDNPFEEDNIYNSI
jgi:hypothetical protein